MTASFKFNELLEDPKAVAGALLARYNVPIWLIVASQLLTAFQMREGVATLIVLALNALTLWLAVGPLKRRQAAIWLAVASEIMTATQMAPSLGSVTVLLVNAGVLALAILAARLASAQKAAA